MGESLKIALWDWPYMQTPSLRHGLRRMANVFGVNDEHVATIAPKVILYSVSQQREHPRVGDCQLSRLN